MSGPGEDRLDLPYKKPLVAAGIGLVLLVVALAWIDRWRSERHLTRLEASFCALEVPEAQLATLAAIDAPPTRKDKRTQEVATAFTRLVGQGRVEVLFEIAGEPWVAKDWTAPDPLQKQDLPRGYTSWAELKSASCAGTFHQGRYQFVRPLDSPNAPKVVLVWRVARESDLFD